ncbi:discoidin domain-containing protein [Pendulispora rubella]|uniref:Discoidin domain-containing protein n=1 Tax=Pendulispora rubella TaxID=2741070 RepID=A0ABZ2L827_9BACT
MYIRRFRSIISFGLVGVLSAITGVAESGSAPAARIIDVSTASQLTAALQNAMPGDEIRMANGTYAGHFTITRSGTESAPIVLSGSRAAVIDGQGTSNGRAVQLQADYWKLVGFTVTNGQKGIMALGAHHTIVDGVRVHQIGDEAIHFRDNSSDNVVQNSEISDTGLREPGFGEGIYFGQAVSNWPDGQPDRSDRNKAIGNRLGPNVRAECLDLKEGTTGGEVRDNVFNGTGMSGENFADSWIDAKGNGYRITGNRGTSALLDGFQTHIQVAGWGRDNVFSGNTANVGAAGFGFKIAKDGNTSAGNVVCTDNVVTNATSGVANIPLTDCGGGGGGGGDAGGGGGGDGGGGGGGRVEVTPAASGVSASADDGNAPANTVDNDVATRWSASGDGQWIAYDLGTTFVVREVAIAVYKGDSRRAAFDLQASSDGTNWQTIWSGRSSGASTAQENYDFPDVNARFIRYVGHGNDVNAWNSLTEVDIFAAQP